MIEVRAPSVSGLGSRRRTIRIAASHVRAFVSARLLPVEVVDISAGGFSSVSSLQFDIDSVHVVRFTLGRISVNARGRVLHCRPVDPPGEIQAYVTGFAFVGRARPDGSTIDDLIDAITTSAVSFRISR